MMTIMLVACGDNQSTDSEQIAPDAKELQSRANKIPATAMLLYDVNEPGTEPYQSRVIVNDAYIRLDENYDGNDFVLVDRKQEIVYSVSNDNDAILVVNRHPVDIPAPMDFKLSIDKSFDENAPQVDGKDVVHYVFKVNGEPCNDAMIAEGLLMNITQALAEYRHILAGQHAATLKAIPADVRNACDMASHIFHPDRHLQFGLPVQESDYSGYKRSLVDFDDDWTADPKLFVLPAEFGRFSIDDMKAPAEPEEATPAATPGTA
jgi:hypothetical protein